VSESQSCFTFQTAIAYDGTFSRRITPELCVACVPLLSRGRREGRVLVAPMVRVQKKSTRQNHRYAPDIRPSLRNGFTAYSALSPGTGVLAPVVGIVANLTSAPGCQDHTAWPCVSRLFVRMDEPRCNPTRPPHPTSTFVTIAIRPSWRGEMAIDKHDFRKNESEKLQCSGLSKAIRLKEFAKLVFWRRDFPRRPYAHKTRIVSAA
jgi:hypothetical protein